MTTKARLLATRLANGGRFTVRIEKRNGTRRQMRFQIAPHAPICFSGVDHSPMIRVHDLDRKANRTLRLDSVSQLTELPEIKQTFEQVHAKVHELFF